MKKIKTTFVVDQKDIDKKWSLKELLNFSARCNVRVVIRKFCVFENGIITYMA